MTDHNESAAKVRARNAAWRQQGVTFWRPPTPRELREIFNEAFNAGWSAAYRHEVNQWTPEDELAAKIGEGR